MSHLISVDLETLTPAEAEILAGFLLVYAEGKASGFVQKEDPLFTSVLERIRKEEKVPAPPAIDPAAAFGNVATGKISEAGPSLVIPAIDPSGHSVGLGKSVEIPTQPAAAPPAPAGGSVTLDSSKLPWDSRIHASSKSQNADGTWRLKRGLAKDFLDKVTAELRQVMAIPSQGPQLVPPPPPAPVPGAAAAPPPPPSNEAAIRDQYIQLFGRVSGAMSSGKLTQEQLDKCLAAIGIPSMPLLGARLDLVPNACALIDGVIAGASA